MEQRLKGAEAFGEHKTAMRQASKREGRPRLTPWPEPFQHSGRATGVATPRIDAIHACVKLLEQHPVLAHR
jgi:hypothetical protein